MDPFNDAFDILRCRVKKKRKNETDVLSRKLGGDDGRREGVSTASFTSELGYKRSAHDDMSDDNSRHGWTSKAVPAFPVTTISSVSGLRHITL